MNIRLSFSVLLTAFFLQTYSQLPVNGLVAHYTFDNNASDNSPFGHNGKINGGIQPIEDRFGNKEGALHFNGVDGFISVASSTELRKPKVSITICSWIKLEKGKASSNDMSLPLLSKSAESNSAQYRFYLKRLFGDSKSIIFSSSESSLQDHNYNSHPLEFNQWCFVAMVLDENWLQLYINGKVAAVTMSNKLFVPNDAGLEIGRDNIGGIKYFSGSMDDLRIYNRGLSASEISVLFNDTPTKSPQADISIIQPKQDTVAKQAQNDLNIKQPKKDSVLIQPKVKIAIKQPKKDTIAKLAPVELTVKHAMKDTVAKQAQTELSAKHAKKDLAVSQPKVEVAIKQLKKDTIARKATVELFPKQAKKDTVTSQTQADLSKKHDKKDSIVIKPKTEVALKQNKKDTLATLPREETVAATKQVQPILTIKLPESIEQNTDNGKCFAKVVYGQPTATSSDGGKVQLKLAKGFLSGSAFTVGKHTVTYQASTLKDKQFGTFGITVTDNEAPRFTCPKDIVAEAISGFPSTEVAYPSIDAYDNCPNVKLEMVTGFKSGNKFPLGITTVKYRATDASGNRTECSFTVTVNERKTLIKGPETKIVKTTPELKEGDEVISIHRENKAAIKEVDVAVPSSTKSNPVKVEEAKVVKTIAEPKKEDRAKFKEEKPTLPVAREEELKGSVVEKKQVKKDVATVIPPIQKLSTAKVEDSKPAKTIAESKKEESVKLKEEKPTPAVVKTEERKASIAETKPVAKEVVVEPKKEQPLKPEEEKHAATALEEYKLPVAKNKHPVKEEMVAWKDHSEQAKTRTSSKKNKATAAAEAAAKEWHFNCEPDTTIHLAANRRGVAYHYAVPTVSNPALIDTIEQVMGTHDGCFLPVGVNPLSFKATDHFGKTQSCTYSVIVKDDLPPVSIVAPEKIETALNLGNDAINYEHKAEVDECFLTVMLYDDGEEDNDTVSIIFNGQILVNHEMIRLREHGAIVRQIILLPGNENYIIAKAWNKGKVGLNTMKIDVYEGEVEQSKKGVVSQKPVLSKVLHSKPGNAGGMILRCK